MRTLTDKDDNSGPCSESVHVKRKVLLAFNFAVLCLCRKVDGPRAPRDERRRAQHNEGGFKYFFLNPHIWRCFVPFSFVFFFCSREKKKRQNQQLDSDAFKDHPRLQRGQQDRSCKCGKKVSGCAAFKSKASRTGSDASLVVGRVKEASCPRPATTSGSCGRTTSGCRRATRRWSGWRWTTSC